MASRGAFTLILVAGRVLACWSLGYGEVGFRRSAFMAERDTFLDDLHELLGHGHRASTEARLASIKARLSPTFTALPKTSGERISASSARYAVHRHFVQHHGWYVKGIVPEGGSLSWGLGASAVALGLGRHLPEQLRDLLGTRFNRTDYGLDELTLLTASIQALNHAETTGRLYATYTAYELDPATPVSAREAHDLLYACITSHQAGFNVSQLTRQQIASIIKEEEARFPLWKHTRARLDARLRAFPRQEMFSFEMLEQILEAFEEKIEHRVDSHYCRRTKEKLVEREDKPGSGRLKLSDFYDIQAKDESWDFRESPEYLRRLGTLDDSDPTMPRLIVSNYLTLDLFCKNVSVYYDVCCIDRCESWIDHLEAEIKAPQASPAEIMRILRRMSSEHGRNWSGTMVRKLEEVAARHGGQVPLHGRLFLQWMHFAYPRDCIYPHPTGTLMPLTAEERRALRKHGRLSEEGVLALSNLTSFAPQASNCSASEDGMCMWVAEEELVDEKSWQSYLLAQQVSAPFGVPGTMLTLRATAFVAVFVLMWRVVRQVYAGMDALPVSSRFLKMSST